MWIFAGVPWKWDVKRQWGCRQRRFSVLTLAISSEPLQIRPSLYTAIRSPSSAFHELKIQTWNDLEDHFSLSSVFTPVCCACETVAFEGNYAQTNKDKPTLSATQIFNEESSFWWYKVYADILGDSLERRRQTTVGSCVNIRAAHWRIFTLFVVCVINQPVHRT